MIAAISVSGPISRVTYKILEELKREIKDAARLISMDLGWLEKE